jgi:adenylate kinase family enzyme
MVFERLRSRIASEGFILDGYPRTTAQAEEMMRLAGWPGIREVVIHLVVDYNIIIARLTGRRECPRCGTLYNVVSRPPKGGGCVRSGREKLVFGKMTAKKWSGSGWTQYERQTRPVMEFFRRRRRVIEVDASQDPPEAVFQRKDLFGAWKTDDRDVRKTPRSWRKMRRSGLLVYQILQRWARWSWKGISTWDLEVAAVKMMATRGEAGVQGLLRAGAGEGIVRAVYFGERRDRARHAEPEAVLKKGDIVSIDTGVSLDGYFGDSAIDGRVGELSEQTKKLLKVTQESLELAIDKVREGNRLFDICGTVEQHVVVTGFRSCGSMWDTASGRSCMKSRRFRIMWTGGTRIPGCARAWCWRSSRW